MHELFTWTAKGQQREFTLPADKVVDWRLFFESDDPLLSDMMNFALPLSVRVQDFDLPDKGRVHMPAIAMQRGEQLQLPSGQEVCEWLLAGHANAAQELGLQILQFPILENLPLAHSCRRNTPLWAYIMLDSGYPHAPHKLGILGGWLLADTLHAAASFVEQQGKPWTVQNSLVYKTLVSERKEFRSRDPVVSDLIKFTYQDEV